MPRRYNLASKSDMRRWARDLEKDLTSLAQKQVLKMKHNIPCPHCVREISVSSGWNVCPYCANGVDLQLQIS